MKFLAFLIALCVPLAVLALDPAANVVNPDAQYLESFYSGVDFGATATWVTPMGEFRQYQQCDAQWGSHIMTKQTICKVGCFMSSVASGVRDHGIKFKLPAFGELPVTSNPGTFNDWLRRNGGYTDDNFISDSVSGLCKAFPEKRCSAKFAEMHRTNDLTVKQVQAFLKNYVTVLANVKKGGHFVRIVGWNADAPDALQAMDPGVSRTVYSHSQDVVGWRIFALVGEYTPKSFVGMNGEVFEGEDAMDKLVINVLGDNFAGFSDMTPDCLRRIQRSDSASASAVAANIEMSNEELAKSLGL